MPVPNHPPTRAATSPSGDATPASQAPRLSPGTLLSDRYAIVELLGEGGMGAVYRAEHTHLRKSVAVKVLHADFCDSAEIVARFEREAIAASHIEHPHVAAATDFGRLPDGSFFLVLELVTGRTLRTQLDQGPLEVARALRILHGIAEGVGAAHARGVVHRDLKPENVMLVDRDGDPDFVKVLDFGIARVDPFATTGQPTGAQPLTRVGEVFGTPDYMSPEQALGQAVDARADLYALGIILFEMLTGERPFRGGAVTVLRERVLSAEPPALPPDVAARVGPWPCEIARKLLMADPALRFQTAEQLAAAIVEASRALDPRRHALAVAPPSAPAGPRPAVARRGIGEVREIWRRLDRRHRTLVAVAAAALAVGVTTTIVAMSASGRSRASGAPSASAEPIEPPAEWLSTAPQPSASGSPSPPELPLPPDPEAPTSRPTDSAAQRAAPSGHAHHKSGPGGIYIPPPRTWFR